MKGSHGFFIDASGEEKEADKWVQRRVRCTCGSWKLRRGHGTVCPRTDSRENCVLPEDQSPAINALIEVASHR